MTGLTLGLLLSLLALHIVSVCLTRALRTYSRSRLEELALRLGHVDRADEIARHDERTERSAEALAILTGLGLAALLGAASEQLKPRLGVDASLVIALVIGGLGHVAAGVYGRVNAESVLVRLWPLAGPLRFSMAPLTALAREIEAIAYRRSRHASASPRPASVEVEIHTTHDDPADDLDADLPETTRSILERAVELSRRDVADIMIPASAMVTIPASASPRDAAEVVIRSGRSRIPVYGENRDDIVGILYAKDLFPILIGDEAGDTPLRKLARPALFIPETKNATELLDELLARRAQLAIVMDEYGAVAGLVSLEDLLEELVGPIDDEHDRPAPADPIVPVGERTFDVDAALEIETLNERLGLHLPMDEDYSTLGGFAFTTLGRLPELGASFRRDGVEFTVLDVSDRSIRRLRVDLQPGGAGAPADENPANGSLSTAATKRGQ